MSEALPRLVAFTVRLDRLRIVVWGFGLGLLVLVTAAAWGHFYPTQESRAQFASALAATPAVTAFLGPLHDPTTVGGLTSWRLTSVLTLVLGLIGVFLVVRHTRAESAAGRTDLLLSGMLTRRSLPIAALVPPVLTYVLFAVVAWVVLVSFGQSPAGALVFVCAIVAGALFFVALAIFAAGAFPSTRGASAAATLVTALFFLIFVASNAASHLTWLGIFTPFGWSSRAAAFASDNWWWIALPVVGFIAIVVTAIVLAGRRDMGSSLVPVRDGRPTGGPWLSSPLSLAWRVDRWLILVWLCALAVLAVIVGILTRSATSLLDSSEQLRQLIERLGGAENFTDAYVLSLIGTLSLATTAFAITLVLRIHEDEVEGRTELLLSGDVSRRRLLTARVVITACATVAIQFVIGLMLGISYTLSAGAGWAPVGNFLAVALIDTSAVWVMAAVALIAASVKPRLSWLAWAAFVYVVAMEELGALLGLPTWMQATTPFWFVPKWPLELFNWVPFIVLILIAAALVVGSYAGLRRREIPA
jgi:ABC-2 type transport system permease protein